MRNKLLVCVFLVVATLALYWQSTSYEFVNFDDDVYITKNPQLQKGLTGRNVIWAFSTSLGSLWMPLTWLSFMLDFEFWGLNPGGYHLTNLILHIANTLLLFLLLSRITSTLWRGAFVALLFAIHPLHVESVAWVAERKDVLCTLFWILSIWAYTYYTEHPSYASYLLAFITFALGLMAKPVVVTLPFVLLLLDYWPLGRFQSSQSEVESKAFGQTSIKTGKLKQLTFRLIWEKAPFFALATAVSVVTYVLTQRGGGVETLDFLPMRFRIANALISYATYIGKTIWPHNLAVLYPHPLKNLPMWKIVGAGLILVFISSAVIKSLKRFPYLAVGWFWYLVTLVPNIGLVQAGKQAMADRFTYIPLIGLFIMIAWGIPELVRGWRHRKIVLAVLASTLVTGFMVCAWVQVRHWKNPLTLFTQAVNVTDNNYLAHYNLGLALGKEGRIEESMHHSYEALRIRPDYADAHNNIGIALVKQGRLKEAIVHFSEALRINPDYDKARRNLDKVRSLLRE